MYNLNIYTFKIVNLKPTTNLQ